MRMVTVYLQLVRVDLVMTGACGMWFPVILFTMNVMRM